MAGGECAEHQLPQADAVLVAPPGSPTIKEELVMTSGGPARVGRRVGCWAALSAALVVLAATSSSLSAQTKGPELIVPKSKSVAYSLTLITPNQANFDLILESHFPGILDGVSDFQATRPYLVMIRNDSPLPAVAYAIHWEVSYLNGKSQILSSTSISSPLTHLANVTLMPGAIRLVSPSFNLTPAQYQPGSLTGWLSQASLVSPPPVRIASSVPEIAGVVWGGGGYSGPEGGQVWRLWVVARFAARDEARHVLTALNSSTPLATVYSNLDQQYMRGQRYMGPTDMDAYIRDRGRCALRAKTLLQNTGREAAASRLLKISGGSSADLERETAFGMTYESRFDKSPGSAGPADAR